MARIQTYPNDVYVTGNDKWIGSDANNDFITKNFTANAVADYFNRVGIIDTGSFNWSYRMYAPTESQPAKTFELIDHPFDTVDVIGLEGTIKVSFLSMGNTEPGIFIEEVWNDKIILVNRPGFPSEYGLYRVTAVVQDGDYYLLDLDFIGGHSGIVNEDEPVTFGLFAGVSGTSGTTGTSGTSGTTGTSGTSGSDGTSGSSGTTGTSGTSGSDGTSGSSGTTGTSGSSGTGGTSGTSGTNGSAGTSGTRGTSGTSGIDGIDGTDGTSGTDGTGGTSGSSGTSGFSGSSGTSGIDGTSGVNGTSGVDGTSGTNGTSGTHGTSGTDGTGGTSGTTGTSGTAGTSGTTGTSGTGGTSGVDGVSGGRVYYFNNSQSSSVSPYKVLSTEPTLGALQTVTVNMTGNQQNVLVQQFITEQLGFTIIPSGVQRFHLHTLKPQDNDNIQVYVTLQLADSTGTPYGTLATSSVVLLSWFGTGVIAETTLDFVFPHTTISATDRMIVKIYYNNNESTAKTAEWYTEDSEYSYVTTSIAAASGTSGVSGTSGTSGTSGSSGTTGTSGVDGTSGTAGTSGVDGTTGISGTNGTSGTSGIDGTSGLSGTSGTSGFDGTSGSSGTSGATGSSGDSGTSGTSGVNGTSGINGTSGVDGTSGTSGTGGTSGVSPDPSLYVLKSGSTMTGALVIDPANTAITALDVASDTIRFRSDSSEPFDRQLTTTMGSGTLVKIQAAGYGATYVTDLGFYTSSNSAVNTTPNLYLTGGDNRVGINTITPAYTLDVVGTAGVSGVLTLGSTISNGTYNYTLPSASGTLALLSDVPSAASRDVFTYTATEGQTTFTVTGGYTVGLLDVYVNGLKLTSSEVTATNGTTFVLTVASVAGDQVQAIRYNTSVSGISGGGTTNYIPKFTASGTVGNSFISQDSFGVTVDTGSNNSTFTVISTDTAALNVRGGNNYGYFQSDYFGFLLHTQNGVTGNDLFYYDWAGKYLSFGTNNTTRIHITSSGNVGIGTTTPANRLDVDGSIRASGAFTLGSGYAINFYDANTTAYTWIEGSSYNQSYSFLAFTTGGSEKVRIDSSGNVGVGTTAPSYKLDVTGTGRFTGALSGTSATFSSTITGSRNDNTTNVSVILQNSYINAGNLINFVHNSGGSTTNGYIGHGGDSTGNFVIINNAINALSLARATGAATFASTITATGATLTGALSGTSATFSGSITTNGTTLSSWGNVVIPALETINGNSISSYNASNIPAFYLASNAYHNGTSYIRKTANSAMLVSIDGYNNNFQIQSAASSTAGSTISWTQRFNIDGSNGAATFSSSVTASNYTFTDGQYIRNSNQTNGTGVLYLDASNLYIRRADNGANLMLVNSAGNVGIGTTSLSSRLTVDGNDRVIELRGAGSGGNALLRYSDGATAKYSTGYNGGSYIIYDDANSAYRMTISSAGAANFTGSLTGNIVYSSTDFRTDGGTVKVGAGSNNYYSQISTAYNYPYVDSYFDSVAGASYEGRLNFRTSTGGGSLNPRMTIYNNGRVIIGSTSDGGTGLVQIHGTARAVQLVASQGGITAGNYAIYGHDDDNGYINVVRSVYTGDFHFRFDGTTRATINRSTGVYVATSDINKKKDIEESKIGLSEVMQLKPTLYRMKVDSNESEKQLGFIAQDVKGIIPSAYHESGDFIGLNFNPIVAALTKAIQELKAELDIATTRLQLLENK